MMTIQVDSREKPRAIGKIIQYFDAHQIQHFVSKLPVGDYMSLDNPRLVIDRKANLLELCSNVGQQHARFSSELILASNLGIKIIILCEHGPLISCLEDIREWANPRLRISPKAITGERLYKILHTMSVRHNVGFEFCDKRSTGRRIVEILGGDAHD